MAEKAPAPEPAPVPPYKNISDDDFGDNKSSWTELWDYFHSDRRLTRPVLVVGTILFLLPAGFITLVIYLVYGHHSDPVFYVAGAAIYSLGSNANATSDAAVPSTFITASLQLAIVIRNPNSYATICYDRLSAYVIYRSQAITQPAQLPPLFQKQNSAVTVLPVLGGGPVPVTRVVAAALAADEALGVVRLRLEVQGRVLYKSGPFHSGWNGLYARCDVLVGVQKGVAGQVPLIGAPECDVDVDA